MNYRQLTPVTWALLSTAVVLEAAAVFQLISPMLTAGFVEVPWAAAPAMAAVPLLPRPRHSWSTKRAVAFSTLVGAAGLAALMFAAAVGPLVGVAVLFSVVLEEAVFRLAVPGLITILLLRFGVSTTASLIVSTLVAATTFAFLPGHIVQMTSVPMVGVFFSFALLMSYSVWRGKHLWPAIATHAGINFLSLGMVFEVFTDLQRAVGVSACLLSMAFLALTMPHDADGTETDDQTVVDLRDRVLAAEQAVKVS